MTIQKLRKWQGRTTVLADEEQLARDQLEGRPTSRARQYSPVYSSTWLRLRAYAELASEDEKALELLTGALTKASTPESRLAMLTLFLEDWRILGRARLRQTIRPLLLKLAAETLSASTAGSEERMAACSLLRSLHPDQFVESLPLITDHLREDVNLLGRVVMQIASLAPMHQMARQTLTFLQGVVSHIEWFEKMMQEEQSARVIRILTACQQMLLHARGIHADTRSSRQAALALYELLQRDPILTHDARAILEVFAERGEGIREFSRGTLKEFWVFSLSSG
jgi:hypothetical protein